MMADYVENLKAENIALAQRLSEVEAERGDLRDALVRVFGMGDGVTHDAQILAAAVDLVADQERMREALEAVMAYWKRYGFSGWKGDDDFDGLCQQILAALSTPRQEPT